MYKSQTLKKSTLRTNILNREHGLEQYFVDQTSFAVYYLIEKITGTK